MSWTANQIYAPASEAVIAAFRADPFLADQLYHVGDLRGIRNEGTRERVFSTGSPGRDMRHGLPPGGLLVVSPEIYATGYDRADTDLDDFERHFRHNTPWPNAPRSAKWESVAAPDGEDWLPDGVDPAGHSMPLLRFLRSVHEETGSPLVHYQCSTWGGDVEEETAWIVDTEERVCVRRDGGGVLEYGTAGRKKRWGTVLGLAMSAIGIDLPGDFFAPHEASFHWRLYRI